MAGLGGENTEMLVTALIVHEEEDYYLVEATSAAALARLKSDGEYLLSWLFDPLDVSHSEASVTAVMEANDIDALFAKEVKPSTNPKNRLMSMETIQGNPWLRRPNTNTWHPEATIRQTDEFDKEDTELLRERLRENRARVSSDSE